jgi:hypothetical protein
VRFSDPLIALDRESPRSYVTCARFPPALVSLQPAVIQAVMKQPRILIMASLDLACLLLYHKEVISVRERKRFTWGGLHAATFCVVNRRRFVVKNRKRR